MMGNITIREEDKVFKSALKNGMKNRAKYRYLYTKKSNLSGKYSDIFLNLNTQFYEAFKVDLCIEQEQE
tara:strand:- start:382 stop:588 length:207 start_codon:yes stop_codon:yes gene_type:complete